MRVCFWAILFEGTMGSGALERDQEGSGLQSVRLGRIKNAWVSERVNEYHTRKV